MHMKDYVLTIVALAVLCSGCKKGKEEKIAEMGAPMKEAKAPVTLTLKWKTEPLLTTCESVLYDEDQDILYVSNINGQPDAKDGNGFISKVSLDGKVTDQYWVKGNLDAPKGMGLAKGMLYVADITRVHEIDTKTGKITHTYPVAGAVFLNDIAVDNDKVYISDSRGGAIYLIQGGKLSTWMKDIHNPNGLFIDGGKMIMALWDDMTLNTVDLSSKEVTMRTDSIQNPDGVEAIGNNEYIVSSWNGILHYIDSNWKETTLLDTQKDSINSADIEYIKSKNLLLVPTFFKNRVMAYQVEK
jgi:hypothetical protein